MSWLNFNDSLNSLKGQITNFANTVLAEDVLESHDDEVLKETESKVESEADGTVYNVDDPWTWSKTDQLKTDETITNLKRKIEELENENRDLLSSLDQLDQNHQQNTEELVKMKSKLSEELEIVTEKYEILNMKYNKLALAENGYKKKINELKNKCDDLTQHNPSDITDISQRYKRLEQENCHLKQRIAILETNENSRKPVESEMTASMEELQMENKALKIALQTTSELKNKHADDKIIEKYENEIADLRRELQNIRSESTFEKTHNEESSSTLTQDEGSMKNENQQSLGEYQEKLANLQTQLATLQMKKDEEKSYLTEKILEHEKKIEKLLSELNEVEADRSDLQKNCSDLREMKEELEKSNNEIEKTLKQQYLQEIDNLKKELLKKQKDIEDFQSQENENNRTEENVSQRVLNILREIFREYLDEEMSISHDIESFSKSLSNRMKLRFEEKKLELQELDKRLNELKFEKDKEIDRLSNESRMLKQELSNKLKEIGDVEEECSQLMKNNELLISKLEELKETGLQTIFESNEDNVASMEKQLDIASRRIEELEKLVKHDDRQSPSEEEKEEKTDSTGNLEREKECLQVANEELKKKLEAAESEIDNCRRVIDKMRLDFETTEYQFSEMNINLETLSEEIEKHKMKIDLLVSENENLKSLKEENTKNSQELLRTREDLCLSEQANQVLKNEIAGLAERSELKRNESDKECEKLKIKMEEISSENSNLKRNINELSDSLVSMQKEIEINKNANETLINVYNSFAEVFDLENELKNPENFEISHLNELINRMKERINHLQQENINLISELEIYKNKSQDIDNSDIQQELQTLMTSRNELIGIVQTKHQETLTYHAEIQRLSEILKTETEKNMQLEDEIANLKQNSCPLDNFKAREEEIEKLRDQIGFLRQKCDVLAQSLLEEQQKVENEKSASSEKEAALSKKLERLQSHLMEVEEHYTQELLESEQKISILQARLNEVEKREKDSSNVYTSVSIRANQQNEALTQQLQSMTSQRDDFRKRLLDLEDENNIKSAALANLQLVLEQFQRDKELDVIRETDRIRRQVKQEQKIQEDLRKEIANLENQIKESKQGLQAALRLTDQLELSKNQISSLREEVTVLNEKLHKKEEELKAVTSQTDGKVDKSLIKNLIIGFVTSNKNLNKDQKQVLKIIATVLDFNEQDHNKVNLNQAQQSTWLRSLLSPMADDLPPNESLSRAFVNFLENESKPRNIPSLLPQSGPSETSSSVSSSTRTTPTPIVLNEIVLPTFSDFPQHRNSSSILKGVLKDNV